MRRNFASRYSNLRSQAELSREFGPTTQTIMDWPAQDARDVGKLEGWINPHRRHSALRFHSPINFEQQYHDKETIQTTTIDSNQRA